MKSYPARCLLNRREGPVLQAELDACTYLNTPKVTVGRRTFRLEVLKKFGVASLFCLATFARPALALHEGDPAPSFSLPLSDGSNFSSESLRGKVIYLDFWASWCPPCRDALDFLKELKASHGEKGVEIIAVNLDSSRADADGVIEEIHPEFRIVFDPQGTVAKKFELPKMPSSFIIGRDGRIRKIHGGYKCADKPEILSSIQSALEEK